MTSTHTAHSIQVKRTWHGHVQKFYASCTCGHITGAYLSANNAFEVAFSHIDQTLPHSRKDTPNT